MATLAKRAAASEARFSSSSSSSSSSLPPPRIAVADFGCSEGANAVEQMSAAVAAAFEAFDEEGKAASSPPLSEAAGRAGTSSTASSLPPCARALSITVTHSDLTNNGWNAVASAIAAAGPGYANPPSVVALMQASDSGFYERCFGDESLDLAHGAITFHWASRGLRRSEEDPRSTYDSLPSKLEDACILPGLSSDPRVRALAAEASRGDWRRILSHRARELKRGGFLVAALICSERGDDICALWRVLAGCLEELVEAGIITGREASGVVVPVHLRTPQSHRDALEGDGDSDPLSASFRVVLDEVEHVQSPERDAFLGQHRDAKRYGADVAAFFEAVSRTMVEAALAPRLGRERATAVADELYFTRFAGKVAEAKPEFAIKLQTLVLEKL